MSRLNKVVIAVSIIAGLVASGAIAYPVLFQDNNSTPIDPGLTTTPKTLEEFYAQTPLWSDCEGNNTEARCGFIQVPLNWSKPEQGAIKIAVAINPANDPNNAPYLLMNPGGPGSSGHEWITDYLDSLGTPQLRNEYNVVGFDPRGVGKSTAIKCSASDEGLYKFFYDQSPFEYGSEKDLNYTKQSIKYFGEACLEYTGELLGHIDTSSAAKDMDIIRAVLGSEKLNYLGFSYGTLLGATYASFFPENVGRFVLDGVVDPTSTPEQDSINQLVGFESAMRAYLKDCIANDSDCPFRGLSVEKAMDKVGSDFLAVLEKKPAYTSEGKRTLTLASGFTGMISALYSESSWQYLTQAFNEFFDKKKSDGRVFLILADAYFSYDADLGKFKNNNNEAFKAITCIDGRESNKEQDMLAQNDRVKKTSKVFGRYWQYGGLACNAWPFDVVQAPKDYSAKSAPTMLVVGTTNDPATPYSQAKNFAENVLANGHLLTYDGEGHTAYGSSNSCVANTVDDFLINGNLPKKEKTC
jgi:pimeloyl-ACP methyl ester carboxylesterase